MVPKEELATALGELSNLGEVSEEIGGEVVKFRRACETAIEMGCSLKIAGDMHPVLKRR